MSKWFALDDLRCVTLQGPDAGAFAQSQLTVDIERIEPAHWFPAAWCDRKGRAQAFMMVTRGEQNVHLLLPASTADTIAHRMRPYTIGREVQMNDSRPVAGTESPSGADVRLAFDSGRAVSRSGTESKDEAATHRWRLSDLRHGLPWLNAETEGRHLPQWLGLDEIGGLDYDKGCYPGQEVIARLHYRGTIKQRLRGLAANTPADIPGHNRVVADDGKTVGHWLRGLVHEGATVGLAVLDSDLDTGRRLSIAAPDGTIKARVTTPEALC
jgi:hypothetical protein